MKATVGPVRAEGCWEYRTGAESCLQAAAGERKFEDSDPTGTKKKHISEQETPTLWSGAALGTLSSGTPVR